MADLANLVQLKYLLLVLNISFALLCLSQKRVEMHKILYMTKVKEMNSRVTPLGPDGMKQMVLADNSDD